MKVVGLLNILFYSILLIALIESSSSFDLSRHGLDFSWQTLVLGLTYYCVLATYLIVHQRNGRILLDSYNMFLLLFSVLIVPGMIATGSINDSHIPHLAALSSGIIFLILGIMFDVLSPGTTSRYFRVSFHHGLSNNTAITFFVIYLVCVATAILSGSMNRAGSFNVILGLFSSNNSTVIGSIAEYRTEIYHSWSIKQVIGNYAGAVFGPFFALILCTHLFKVGRHTTRLTPKLIAITIIAFPIIFAIGSGSRLILLRTLLIYLVFATIPYGLRLIDRQFIKIGALIFALLIISTSIMGRGIQGDTFSSDLVIQAEKSIARLFLGKGGSTMAVYEYYPEKEPFEGITPIIEKLLGVEIDGLPSVARKIFSYLTNGSIGTAGPQTFGYLYASFGYLGQLLFTPLIAIILLSLRLWYRRISKKNSLDRALWAFLVVSIGYTGYSDMSSFKAIGFVYVLFIYVILRFIATSLSSSREK